MTHPTPPEPDTPMICHSCKRHDTDPDFFKPTPDRKHLICAHCLWVDEMQDLMAEREMRRGGLGVEPRYAGGVR